MTSGVAAAAPYGASPRARWRPEYLDKGRVGIRPRAFALEPLMFECRSRFITRACALILSTAVAVPSIRAADGDPDPGFGTAGVAMFTPNGVTVHEMTTRAVIALPDGRLLAGGARNYFDQSPDPHQRPSLVRFEANGTVDTRFGNDVGNPGLLELPSVAPTAVQSVEAMRRLVDGSIVVVGTAFAIGPLTGFVMKLDENGVLDEGFGDRGIVTVPGAHLHALDIDARPDFTRIVVAGERASGLDIRGIVIRLDSRGARDPSFGADSSGEVVFEPREESDMSYIRTLAVDRASRVVVAGSHAASTGMDFSVARLDEAGRLDGDFADGGWRVFRMPGDASDFNGINQLLLLADRRMVFAGYRWDDTTGTGLVLGGLDENGAPDGAFGDPRTPSYRILDVAPEATNRYPSAFVRQDDGKLIVAVTYSVNRDGPQRQAFMAMRVSPSGMPDASFGQQGLVRFDLAPQGGFSDSTAMVLQAGRPLLAGATLRDTSSHVVDLALVRMLDGEAADDNVFVDGFDPMSVPRTITYDDVEEGFQGESWLHEGVSYDEVNGVSGMFPDGSTFAAADIGTHLVIERAPLFYDDFPKWGSAPNALTFGDVYVTGDNFSIGPLARVTMRMAALTHSADVDLAYYENGPWGGIELHLDAYRDEVLVASDGLTVASVNPGRDNPAVARLSIHGADFDTLRLYATWNGVPSAPRVMIDNLVLSSSP